MRYSSIFFVFLLHSVMYAQKTVATSSNLPIDADTFVGVDYLENSYYIKEQTLFKKDTQNTFQYSNILLGEITSVDIINPSEVVIFYRDFNTVIIVDTKLNSIDTINFNNKTVSFATKASADRLWIYNADSRKIELYNYKTEKVEIFSDILFKEQPLLFKSDFNHVYVLTKKQKLLSFNSFLVSSIISEATKIDNFAFENNFIVLQQENTFYNYTVDKTREIMTTSNQTNLDFCIKNNTIYVFNGKKILAYNIPKID